MASIDDCSIDPLGETLAYLTLAEKGLTCTYSSKDQNLMMHEGKKMKKHTEQNLVKHKERLPAYKHSVNVPCSL